MDGISLLDILPGVLAVLGADVDVQVLRLQLLLVHVFGVDHGAVNLPGVRVDHHLMAGVQGGKAAAGPGHPQQAVVLNVGDDHAHFIDVGRQQDLEGGLGVEDADDIAGVIRADLVAVGGHFRNDLLLQGDLMTGDGHAV